MGHQVGKKEIHNRQKGSVAVDPVRISNNAAQVGNIIDTLGFDSLEFFNNFTFVDVDARVTVLMEEGADSGLSDAAAVADADLYGTEAEANPVAGAGSRTTKIGYAGDKRFVRITLTPTDNTSNLDISSVAVQAHAHAEPVT